MPSTDRAFANTYTSFDATLLTNDFQLCDPGIPEPVNILRIVNTSDVNVLISFDGIDPQDIIREYSDYELNFESNAEYPSDILLLPRYTKVWVAAEVNPGKAGDIYVISYFEI